MKTIRLLLLALPLLFVAATLRHQAFGPLRFGMTEAECTKHMSQLQGDVRLRKTGGQLTAADVRNHFVNSGAKRPGALTSLDSTIPCWVIPDAQPTLTRMSVSKRTDSLEHARPVWALFRDIGDSKFNRVGKGVDLPTVADIQAAPGGIVTDVWEFEGITIKLSVLYRAPDAPANPPRPDAVVVPTYDLVLSATETTPPSK